MKILSISHSAILKVNQVFFEHLIQKGHQVRLLVPKKCTAGGLGKDHSVQLNDKIDMMSLDGLFLGNGSLFFFYKNLKKVIKEYKPDVFYLDEEPWSFIALQCLLALRDFPEVRFVFYTKQNIYKKYPIPFSWIEQKTYQKSQLCFSISQETTDALRKKGYDKEVIELPHAVDFGLFSPLEQVKEETHITIGFVGRFISAKGGRELIIAFSNLHKTHANTKLVLIGGGEEKERWMKLTQDLGLEEAITFEAPYKHDEMKRAYTSFDILAVPSLTTKTWKEQFGRILIEAAACGVPVVASSSGEIPNVVASLGNGLIYSELDLEEFKEKLTELVIHHEKRIEFRTQGLKNVQRLFSYDAITEKFIKAFQEKS